MNKILILLVIAVLAFIAGRLFAKMRKRFDETTRVTILAIVSLFIAAGMAVRGFTLGWTTATIIFVTIGLLSFISNLAVMRRNWIRKDRGY